MPTLREERLGLLRLELELTQRQMDKYDQISATIKNWAVTLWAASAGWSFQARRREIILLSFVIILIFWGFDSIYKTFREDYKSRRDQVGRALAHFFRTESFPEGTISPDLPRHDLLDSWRHLFEVHLASPYILLAVISLTIYASGI